MSVRKIGLTGGGLEVGVREQGLWFRNEGSEVTDSGSELRNQGQQSGVRIQDSGLGARDEISKISFGRVL